MDKESFSGASNALLEWYDSVKRDLPWRRTEDPYRIWLSEVMLQQTQVASVIPYYEAFLERFPTVIDLAEAEIDEVLARWSGLGYYRRARQLHAAAQEIAASGGRLPTSARELEALPGIGSYTSAAIASIAFGEGVAVLDGNVERVTARLLALAGNPKHKAVRSRLLEVAEKLLDAERPGDSNQAMMELGATVCRPRNPSCLLCPLAEWCEGKGRAEAYPSAKPRRAVEKVSWAMAIVRRPDGKMLLFKRGRNEELMPGLWELPNQPLPSSRKAGASGSTEGEKNTRASGSKGGDAKETRKALARSFGTTYGGVWTLRKAHRSFVHGITHRSITVELYHGELRFEHSEVAEGREAAWVGPETWDGYAMSSMVEKALAAIADED